MLRSKAVAGMINITPDTHLDILTNKQSHSPLSLLPPFIYLYLQEQLEKLDDAVTELMVGVGGQVRLLLGEAFVETSEDYATEYCERKQEELQAKVEEMSAEKDKIATRQQELKKALYGRFGASINLEEK